jgi:hypothetical protein
MSASARAGGADMAETSSWLTAAQSPPPGDPPRMAKLPPNVIRVGVDPEPKPYMPPPEPQPLSEPEARRLLGERQKAKHEADGVLSAAEAAYQRAAQHLAGCTEALASFATLEAEIVAATTAQLRSGDGVELDELFRDKIAARGQAHAALTPARAAEQQLATELATSRKAAADAATGVERAIRDVLFSHAAVIGARYLERLAEVSALAATCAGCRAVLGTPSGVVPPAMKAAIAEAGTRTSAHAQWRAAADALRRDPSAEVTITMEPMPEPPSTRVDNTQPPVPWRSVMAMVPNLVRREAG